MWYCRKCGNRMVDIITTCNGCGQQKDVSPIQQNIKCGPAKDIFHNVNLSNNDIELWSISSSGSITSQDNFDKHGEINAVDRELYVTYNKYTWTTVIYRMVSAWLLGFTITQQSSYSGLLKLEPSTVLAVKIFGGILFAFFTFIFSAIHIAVKKKKQERVQIESLIKMCKNYISAAVISAVVLVLYLLIGTIIAQGNIWGLFIDIPIILALCFGVNKKSRVASVLLLLFIICIMIVNVFKGHYAAPIGYFSITIWYGVINTFRYHNIQSMSGEKTVR